MVKVIIMLKLLVSIIQFVDSVDSFEFSEDEDESLKDDIFWKDYKPTLCSKTFSSLLKDPSTHDVTFKTSDGGSVSAHRVIVAAGSPVFHAMLYGNMKESSQKEIELPNVDSSTLQRLFHYIYTGRVRANLKDSLEFVRAARYFNIDIGDFWLVQQAMILPNYYEIVTYALHWQLDELFKKCVEYMEMDIEPIIKSSVFHSLPLPAIFPLLNSSDLDVRELDLFMVLVEWYKQHKDTISDDDVKSLFQQIRYPLIQKNDLIGKVHPTSMADPDLYKAALEYHETDKFDGPEDQLKLRQFYFPFKAFEYKEDLRLEHTIKGTTISNNSTSVYEGTGCTARLFLRDKQPVNFILTVKFCYDDDGAELHFSSGMGSYSIELSSFPRDEELQGSITKNGGRILAKVGDLNCYVSAREDETAVCFFSIVLYQKEEVCILRL